MQTADQVATELALQFRHVLARWLSTWQLQEIDRRNATSDYPNDCATHDFCDANEAMAEAFRIVAGREPEIDSEQDLAWMNAAWDLAKKEGFATC